MLVVLASLMVLIVDTTAHAHPPTNLCDLDPRACKGKSPLLNLPGLPQRLPLPVRTSDETSPSLPDSSAPSTKPTSTGTEPPAASKPAPERPTRTERTSRKRRFPKKRRSSTKTKTSPEKAGGPRDPKDLKHTESDGPPSLAGSSPTSVLDSSKSPQPAPTTPSPSISVRAQDRKTADAKPQTSAEPGATNEAIPERSTWATTTLYLWLGYLHILPRGLDHILFVIALFLASTKLRPLLAQISAFTLAHTITLALAITGLVQAPAHLIEPLIALSIAFVAVENIYFEDMTSWRPFIVFGFGLFHGLGFASVLTELGLPSGQLVNSLISFNVGVELGQLTVVAMTAAPAFLLLRRLKDEDVEHLYRPIAVVPTSLVIAAVALFWTVQRTLGWG